MEQMSNNKGDHVEFGLSRKYLFFVSVTTLLIGALFFSFGLVAVMSWEGSYGEIVFYSVFLLMGFICLLTGFFYIVRQKRVRLAINCSTLEYSWLFTKKVIPIQEIEKAFLDMDRSDLLIDYLQDEKLKRIRVPIGAFTGNFKETDAVLDYIKE